MDPQQKVTIKNRKTGDTKKVKRVELPLFGIPLDFNLGKKDLVSPVGNSGLVSPISNSSQIGRNLPNDTYNIAEALVRKHFPKNQWQNALKVIQGESGFNPQAVGDNYPIRGEVRPSYGLFQIRTFPDRPSPRQLMDPETNVAYAAKLYGQQGWRPWTAARKLGLY